VCSFGGGATPVNKSALAISVGNMVDKSKSEPRECIISATWVQMDCNRCFSSSNHGTCEEKRTKNREQRTENREQRTKKNQNRSQRTLSISRKNQKQENVSISISMPLTLSFTGFCGFSPPPPPSPSLRYDTVTIPIT
jgi:hypothetical protein